MQTNADARLNMGSKGVFSLMEQMLEKEQNLADKSKEAGHKVSQWEL